MKNRLLIVLAAVIAVSFSAEAKVVLPHIFGDNMVLQQETEARIWGTAAPAAVRYGFRNCAGASLYNCFGIPASSCRTDSW